MNAADYYGLDELKQACSAFIESCITVDTVCALLATAERYIQYKCTKVLVQKVSRISALWAIGIHEKRKTCCVTSRDNNRMFSYWCRATKSDTKSVG
jgi:hypothetical protein